MSGISSIQTAPLEPKWASSVQAQTRLVYQQIGAMHRLAAETGAAPEFVESACAGLYRVLEQLHSQDMVVARTLDEADLLMRLRGEGLQGKSPRLGLVNGVMGDVRKQLGAMMKTLACAVNESLAWPKDFDLALCAFEPTNFLFGFAIPELAEAEMAPRETGNIVNEAARQALLTFGEVTALVNEADGWDKIRAQFPDPKLRDAALSAVGQLAPSGRKGISLMELGGKAFKHAPWRRLDPQTRAQVKSWLDQSGGLQGMAEIEVTGIVRAVDLDFRRCDLKRGEQGLPDLRCIFGPELDPIASAWLNRSLTFRGMAELWQGQPRLLRIQRVVMI